MIQIVMKPVPGAGMVNRENLYAVLFNGEDDLIMTLMFYMLVYKFNIIL